MSVRSARTLPRVGTFPEFALPDASGRVWRKVDFRGSIWIASTFPRACSFCALLGLKSTDLQTSLEKARGVVLVSFVSDPALREPPRLSELAREFGARPGRWLFLSGDAASIPPGTVLLVDRSGETRAEFDVTGPDFSSEVLDAVGDLLRENRAAGPLAR
jgi:cytochrome oxidase Cu insertion factor (SCO1/SenC/PrrC family)